MKLSRLYTNRPTLFTPIRFRQGLNVLIARVRHPKDPDKLSHCLGKTLLIDVIEFCLLKKVGTQDHFLKTRDDLFGDLVFYLEIELHGGGYVTVRRPVREATNIAFKRHADPNQDFNALADDQWDHPKVNLTQAVKLLDSMLALSTIKPYVYRHGVAYFMRRQGDYRDEFHLSKFVGKDINWKPYIAKILGLDDRPLIEKYEADAEQTKIKAKRDGLQAEIAVKPSDYEKLRASIAVKRDEVGRKVTALDKFEFHPQEIALTQELAEKVEQEIADTNELLYNARFDLAQIERGLQDEIKFDLADVQRVFKEAEIAFPGQLARDYNDLVAFNRKILDERRTHLLKRAEQLRAEIVQLESSASALSAKRRDILNVLGGTDSLKKFKSLQGQLDVDRANLTMMEEKVTKFEAIKALNEDLRAAEAKSGKFALAIEKMVSAGSERFSQIQLTFNRIVKEVLHRNAILYVQQNGEGNLDFHAEFTEPDSEARTQERRGTTFNQILCIAFDLAVLTSYARDPFFHFVYHDGALEHEQNKMRVALLKSIREICTQHGIQYIFSALEEELPTGDEAAQVNPKPEEIIVELHDGGDSGRLFKCARF